MNTRFGCLLPLCGMMFLSLSSFGGGTQASVSNSYKEVPDGLCDGMVADPQGHFSFSATIPLPDINLAAFDKSSTVLEIDFTDPGQWFQESLPFTLGYDRSYKSGQSFTFVAETPGVGPPGHMFTAKFTTTANWTSTSLVISTENNVDYLSGATAYTMDGTTNISDTLIVSVTFGTYQTQILVPMTGRNTAMQTTDCGGNGITLNSGSVSGTTVTEPPVVTLTSPAPNSEVYSPTPQITLSGSAKTTSTGDTLESIYFFVNGVDNGTNLIADNLGAITSTNWSVDINLAQVPGGQPGTNTVTVVVYDSLGQSATASRAVVWVVAGALVIVTNGDGSVSPPADLSKSFVVGVRNTVTALPAKNWFFYNWTSNGTVLSTNAKLKFALATTNTTIFQANFVTNSFLAAQGEYYGLFIDTNGPREQGSSGGFSFNLSSSGSFTGSLRIGSSSPALTGSFNVGGWAQANSKLNSTTSVTTVLQLDFANQTVSGTVSNPGFVAALGGFRNVFSSASKATAYQGRYTLITPGTNDVLYGPYGTSYGTVTVSSTGTLGFAGALADGTTGLSQSSAVSAQGDWPLYLSLYGGAGSLWGWASISNHDISGSLSWINPTNTSKTAVYRSGFTNQEAVLAGGYYTNKPLFGASGAQVVLEEIGLGPFAITNSIGISSSGVVTVSNKPSDKLSLKITPSTGVISGTFLNPLNPKKTLTINGVLLQNQTNAQGYFLGTNQSGTVLLDSQ